VDRAPRCARLVQEWCPGGTCTDQLNAGKAKQSSVWFSVLQADTHVAKGCLDALWGPNRKGHPMELKGVATHTHVDNHPTRQAMVVQRADMKRASFKGVAIGNVVDIVASNLVMVPIMIYVLASAKTGSPPNHGAACHGGPEDK
jgi:hypothetical protein